MYIYDLFSFSMMDIPGHKSYRLLLLSFYMPPIKIIMVPVKLFNKDSEIRYGMSCFVQK